MPHEKVESIRIRGSIVDGLGRYLSTLDLDMAALADDLKFTFDGRGAQRERFVSVVEFSRFLDRLARQLGDPCIGLNWARIDTDISVKQIVLAARYSPSPLEALRVMARFSGIVADLSSCEVVLDGETVHYSWEFSAVVVQPAHLNDRLGSSVARQIRGGVGNAGVVPQRVELTRLAPPDSALHRKAFGCPVRFGKKMNKLIYSREELVRPNPDYDPELFEVLVDLCERHLADVQRADDLTSVVRHAVLEKIESPDLSLDLIARDLGMSPRGLQRQLAKYGTTFQEVQDRLRRDLARELLLNTGASISEIAYRVGFSATGNFTRAAKRWFGLPPKQWRERQALHGR